MWNNTKWDRAEQKQIKGRKKKKHLTDRTWMDIVKVRSNSTPEVAACAGVATSTQGKSLSQRGEREMFQAPFFVLFNDSALVQIISGSVSPAPRTTTEGGGLGPSQTSLAKLGPTIASTNTRK